MFKKLRNYFVICAVALFGAMALTACGDDEDENEKDIDDAIESVVNKTSLVGKWMVVSDKGWEKEDGKIIDSWNDTYQPNEIIFEFKSNGKAITPMGDFEDEEFDVYWKTRGDDVIILTYCSPFSGEELDTTYFKYKLSGNDLTLIIHEKETDYEFYTETKLVRVK